MTAYDSNLHLGTALLLLFTLTAATASAHHRPNHGSGDSGTVESPKFFEDMNWMHSDVWASDGAHALGWTGLPSTRITVIDDFTSDNRYKGTLERNPDGSAKYETLRHGEWTSKQTQLVAPDATDARIDFNSGHPYVTSAVDEFKFDAVNLSYGLIARAAFASAYNNWDNLGDPHRGVLHAVNDNLAFAAKAAGNDNGAAVGATVNGKVDVLAQQFIRIVENWGTRSGDAPVIFVGALEWNPDGTDGQAGTEKIASYSNVAGTNLHVQSNFLVVGVEGGRTATDAFANYGSKCGSVAGTCLYGTSFAAPVVAGYAAIVADKFNATDPSLVANQLLETATYSNLPSNDPAIYGMGEACLRCALAPVAFVPD